MNKTERKNRYSLTLLLAGVVFVILLISSIVSAIDIYFLMRLGLIADSEDIGAFTIMIYMAVISLIMGAVIALFAGKFPLRPVNKIISQMNRLASGDFKTRLEIGKPFGNIRAANEIKDSFNKMAQEPENTEMLRSDFINNFSHEFKTPIVSIAGFAKLLKRGNLTEEQKAEYIDIIEEESMRLSSMATNVLNLTKVENQTILTDVSSFNLSEQLRSCVLLLEDKWSKKNLDFNLELSEHIITANEELLKQVWINLLDNAVKFSPDGGMIILKDGESADTLSVTVANSGSEISPENRERIFNKFYQADESHSTMGNGIGLAIVKRITQLHGGEVSVNSSNNMAAFTVTLPKNAKK